MTPESSPADAVMSLKTEPGIYSSVMFLFFHWASRIIPCNWVYSLATSCRPRRWFFAADLAVGHDIGHGFFAQAAF